MSTPLVIALGYIRRGWNPVPIPYRSKNPAKDGWHTRIISVDDAPRHFDGAPQNIGVQLGPHSRGLTDVDLDCAEAIAIAPAVLPPTRAIFGRPSTPAAHRLYYTDLSVTAPTAVFGFNDPKTKKRLVELRHGGGNKGCQTIFPGSTHQESGELIRWDDDGAPASVDGDELHRKARQLATLVLLARYWPRGKSSRHDFALGVGGFLARAGFDVPHVRLYVEAIARAAGDDEVNDRKKAGEDAATSLQRGGNAYGYPKLEALYGPEVARSVADWLGYSPSSELRTENSADELRSVCAADLKMKSIEWLWPDRFAVGKLGILAGLPDEGKGQIFAYIAAMITTGGPWPCDEGYAPKGNVVLLTAEDDLSDTVLPRLAAAGADLARVHIVRMVKCAATQKERMFSLITDLEKLRRLIEKIGNVKLVQIDPVSAYMGVKQIDSFRTNDVRSVLGPIVEMAADMRVTFLGIMHFNKKTDVTNALLRISDSLAYGAAARHVYAVINDNENKRKLFVKAKNNLAAHDQQSLAYQFHAKVVGYDEDLKRDIVAPFVEWAPEPVDVTSSEAMEAAVSSAAPAARDEAKRFLSEYLSGGPMPCKDIEEAAAANGVSRRTLYRIKAELQVVSRRNGYGHDGVWVWGLPGFEDCQR
jgi:hypothetical protein